MTLPDTAPAQTGAGDGFVIIESSPPPRGEGADDYLGIARRKAARTDVTYATELEGDLSTGRTTRRSFEIRERRGGADFGGYGALFAALLVLGTLFLWLKFGGTGTLLSRDPRSEDAPDQAPDSWRISRQDIDLDGRSLLARIARMTDRTEALVYLLRYSLLAGARATNIRFARSDTERSAMARLPQSWKHHEALSALLIDAELAHYGGRSVSDDEFTRAMEIGKTILGGAQHG